MIVVALVLYLWAVRRNNALHPRHRWSAGKTVAWIGALAVTGFAIFSFVGVYDGELFWDHMVQHLLLIMVAAPLFAIASPLELAWRSTRGVAHMVVAECLRSTCGEVLRPPHRRLLPLRGTYPAHPSDQLVQPHPGARKHPQCRAPCLLGDRLPLLAPDLRLGPQRISPPPRPPVLLPVPRHPHRHLHRPLIGRRVPRDLSRHISPHTAPGGPRT